MQAHTNHLLVKHHQALVCPAQAALTRPQVNLHALNAQLVLSIHIVAKAPLPLALLVCRVLSTAKQDNQHAKIVSLVPFPPQEQLAVANAELALI